MNSTRRSFLQLMGVAAPAVILTPGLLMKIKPSPLVLPDYSNAGLDAMRRMAERIVNPPLIVHGPVVSFRPDLNAWQIHERRGSILLHGHATDYQELVHALPDSDRIAMFERNADLAFKSMERRWPKPQS